AGLTSLMVERIRRSTAPQMADRMARFQTITAALSKAQTQEQLARIIAEQSRSVLGAASSSILLLNEDRTVLTPIGPPGPEQGDPGKAISMDQALPITDAVKSGRAVWLESRGDGTARYPAMPAMLAGIEQ